MKRKEFVTKMLVGVPALLIPTKYALTAPTIVCIYVRIDVGNVTLKSIACYDLVVGGSIAVQVSIWDTRTGTLVIRIAYTSTGTPIYSYTSITINVPPSTATLP